MPRRPRLCPVGIPQHIVQRGHNRQVCFAADKDRAAYAGWLAKAADKYDVDIHAWVFMTNHVHLLATPQEEGGLSAMMQYLGRYYVRYFNKTYQRTGTLWQGRFYACVLQTENYLLACQRYIELNPVRAGIVEDPADYKWSSYHANALGIESKLISYHPLYLALGDSPQVRISRYRKLFELQLDRVLQNDIRYSTRKGLVLGTDKFKLQVEDLTGHRVLPKKRGRKPG